MAPPGNNTVALDGVDVVRSQGGGLDIRTRSRRRLRNKRSSQDFGVGGARDLENQLFHGSSRRRSVDPREKTSTHLELRRLLNRGRTNQKNAHRFFSRTPSIGGDNDSSASALTSARTLHLPNRTTLFTSLVILVGLAASTLVLGFGIASAVDQQAMEFDIHASEIITQLEAAWKDYEIATKWAHQSCRNNDFTREEYRYLYEYLSSDGLAFQV